MGPVIGIRQPPILPVTVTDAQVCEICSLFSFSNTIFFEKKRGYITMPKFLLTPP